MERAAPCVSVVGATPGAGGRMSNFKRQRVKDETHEDFIRALPCCIPMCGDNTGTEAAHVSYADPRIGKFGRGKAQREESIWVVPLCGAHHRSQHHVGERVFWDAHKIDPC